jgi:glycosyltransferase involved in cell wall biosynthesis
MRVAQCLQAPLFDHGGVEVLARKLVEGMHDEGIETFLVSPTELNEEQRQDLPGIKETFVWNFAASPRAENARLTAWLRNHQVDLAHFHLGGTYQWASRRWFLCPITAVAKSGIPCVTTNHGAFGITECVGAHRSPWFQCIGLAAGWAGKLRQLHHVQWEATVSQHDLHAVRRWFFPMRRKFLQLYHSKLRGDEFSTPSPSTHPLTPQNPYILCLGTVGRRKGQQYLVEAFLQIADRSPDWRLVLAGRQAHAPTMEKIRALTQSSPDADRVLLMPDVDDRLAHDLLEHAEIFAIPSTGEGLGLTLQEAMYAGCACIGSHVGGIPDLIQEGKTGLLVPPADPKALAQGLTALMEDQAFRTRLGVAAKHAMRVRDMTAQNMVDSYLGLYRQALQ